MALGAQKPADATEVQSWKPQNFTEITFNLPWNYFEMTSIFLGRPFIPLSGIAAMDSNLGFRSYRSWMSAEREKTDAQFDTCIIMYSFSCSIVLVAGHRFLCSHQLASTCWQQCSRQPMTSLRPLPVHLKMGSRLEISNNCWKEARHYHHESWALWDDFDVSWGSIPSASC